MVAFTMGFCLFDSLITFTNFGKIAKNEQACGLSFQFFTDLLHKVAILR